MSGAKQEQRFAAARDTASDSLKARNVQLSKLLAKAGLAAARRDIADQVQRILTDELHHRLKNMLSLVTAIVRQSTRAAASKEEAEAAITRRLVAMGLAHDLLRKTDWQAAAVDDIIRNALDQHNTDLRRVRLEGPQIEAGSAAILPLTLIINELCTNATKYRALSARRRSYLARLGEGRDRWHICPKAAARQFATKSSRLRLQSDQARSA